MVSFNSFSNFLESKFLPVAARVGAQKHLQAIRDGLIVTMPLTIGGSLFLILANLPIPGYPEFMASIFGDAWATKLSYPVRASFDLLALFGCMGIAYRLAEKNKVDMLSAAALSIMTFFILTPYRVLFTNPYRGSYSCSLHRFSRSLWGDFLSDLRNRNLLLVHS